MPLWYDCGAGFVPARLARRDLGADVYLCAPGPSLVPIGRGPGIFVAALTKAYPVVRPDMWFGMDEPRCYDRRLWWEGFMKVARGNYRWLTCEGQSIRQCPQTYFADVENPGPYGIAEMFRRRAHDVKFIWQKNTLGVALHVLIWMGARNLHLVGFDLKSRPGAAYHAGVGFDLPPALHAYNQNLFDEQLTFLKSFAAIAAVAGVRVVSCTPDSPINDFLAYHPLGDALNQSAARVPSAGQLFHCAQP